MTLTEWQNELRELVARSLEGNFTYPEIIGSLEAVKLSLVLSAEEALRHHQAKEEKAP